MAKKRLTFDVEESLHSELKAMAAERKVSLGTLCSGLLSAGTGSGGDIEVEKRGRIAPTMYPNAPLDELRAEAIRLSAEEPKNWDVMVKKINAEIVRRYRI